VTGRGEDDHATGRNNKVARRHQEGGDQLPGVFKYDFALPRIQDMFAG
jgi:hypothetical protein